MFKTISGKSLFLLVLGGLIAGQTGPCGQPAAGGGGGGGGTLVGVWRGAYNDALVGATVMDLVLQPNGNYTESFTSNSSYTYFSGAYYVDFAGTPGLLRLQVLDWFPKEYLGNPILPVAGESWFYSFTDNNNLTLVNYYCTDAAAPGCTINLARQ
jgi:hypothetical protein